METRPCGRSGLELPVLGLGCWAFGGEEGDYWGKQDEREVEAVLERAIEAGAVYLDTAEGYNDGRSELALGKALAGKRERVIIGSKVRPHLAQPQALRETCEGSLRRLNSDYLDLYMLHWPLIDTPAGPVFETLAALQREGKIRHIGVSNFGPEQLREADAAARAAGTSIASNQVCYNLVSRAIEFEILPECERLGIGVLGYMPLQQGLLSGRYHSADELPEQRKRTRHFRGDRPLSRHGEPGAEEEVFAVIEGMRALAAEAFIPMAQLAIHWAAKRPGITCAITGVRSTAQLEEALAGANLVSPAGLVERLTALSEALKEKMGSNADYFQGKEGSRVR